MKISVFYIKMVLVALFVGLFMISCGSSTKIISSWNMQNPKANVMYKTLVLAVMNNREISDNVEYAMVDELRAAGIDAHSATSLFGPNVTSGVLDEEDTKEKLTSDGYTSVMLVTLQDKEEERSYTPGSYYSTPQVVGYSRYYRRYVVAYNRMYTPGTYMTSTNYIMEANIYDLSNDQLVYSAQTRSYNPSSAQSLGHGFAKSIVKEMVEKGLSEKTVRTRF